MTTAPPKLPSIAVPGQRLGPSTTYIPGPGTHLQDSFVCASIAGPVVLQKSDDAQQQSLQKQQQQQQRRTLISVARSFAQVVEYERCAEKATESQTPTPMPTQAPKKPTNNNSSSRSRKYKFNTLPAVDSIVLARVTRVQKRQATISILVVLDDSNPSSSSSSSPSLSSPSLSEPALFASTTNLDNNNSDDLRFQALIRREDVRAVEKDRVVMDEMFRVGDIVRCVVVSLGDQGFYYCSTARNELGVVMARSEGGEVLVPVSWREMAEGGRGGGLGKRELRKVARPF
ncbi:exosome 3'-_5 exonuclease subunit ski4 (Csl4) [Onygenales sp. PD_40]|nr:exosome 3'->5 exonuclease subunit ski4 (Csl4) [Onygenales sp. PD_40]